MEAVFWVQVIISGEQKIALYSSLVILIKAHGETGNWPRQQLANLSHTCFHGETELYKKLHRPRRPTSCTSIIMTFWSELNEFCQKQKPFELPKPVPRFIQDGDQGPFRCILEVPGAESVEGHGKPSAMPRNQGIACTAERSSFHLSPPATVQHLLAAPAGPTKKDAQHAAAKLWLAAMKTRALSSDSNAATPTAAHNPLSDATNTVGTRLEAMKLSNQVSQPLLTLSSPGYVKHGGHSVTFSHALCGRCSNVSSCHHTTG
jgi:hypothetical protein